MSVKRENTTKKREINAKIGVSRPAGINYKGYYSNVQVIAGRCSRPRKGTSCGIYRRLPDHYLRRNRRGRIQHEVQFLDGRFSEMFASDVGSAVRFFTIKTRIFYFGFFKFLYYVFV